MTILVKGMEMPRSCAKCMFTQVISVLDKLGYQCYLSGETAMEKEFARHGIKNCPLVEVPTSHGRLIDADKLFKAAPGLWCHDIWVIKASAIHDMPTVIEAEEA